jgi:gliding motility-associated-like protein
MKKKINKNNSVKRLLKSITNIKSFLVLSLMLSFSTSVKSQCEIIDTLNTSFVNVCDPGSLTGAIDLVLIDPLGSYSFVWTSASMGPGLIWITEDLNNLSADIYSVVVTDNNLLCDDTLSFSIIEPQDPLSSTINLLQDIDCNGDSTGAAFADVIGGFTPYTYLWENGDTTQVTNSLWVGTQVVLFTDSNGCSLTDSIVISQNDSILGAINVLQEVSCFGECDGVAELTSSGGILQYTYFWDNGQVYTGSGPNIVSNLCYGGHSVIIEDALGCRKTVSFNITQPDELFAQAVQVQPVQCYGFDDGSAFAFATGGTIPYSFIWDSPINGSTGQNIDSLTPGVHTVFVTDENGCTASDTVVISEPTLLEIQIVDSMTVYSYCAGTNSGQLCAYASGGTPSYSYTWNDALNQSTECAYDIIAQNNEYTVIVMDERNCIASASFLLDSITESMNPDSVIVDINDVSCFGTYDGSVQVSNVVGAVPPFNFSWNGPSGYTSSGTNISLLYSGSYALVIEDANECAITINAQVQQPDQLEYNTYNAIDETCYGACDGQIWVNITGGTGNYYYDSSQVGTFPIPSNSQLQLINDSLILNLCEATHLVYITDENDCEGAVVWGGSWVEVVDSGAYFNPFPGVQTVDATCFNTNDGQASIAWPGPDPTFNYTWETISSGTIIDTGNTITNLFPGDYNLVIHYADSASFGQNYEGCNDTVIFNVGGPVSLVSNAVVVDENCFGTDDGSIALNPFSSASTYSVVWDTTTSIPNSDIGLVQSPLQPGTYAVTITDSDGCQITEAYQIDEADAMTASISFTPPLCFGDSDGSATVTYDGGTGPGTWNILWSPLGGSGFTTTPIPAGVYTANTTDANGCAASFSVTVTEPDDVIASVEANLFYNEDENGIAYNIDCFGNSTGGAAVINGGGVPPYSYSWSPSGGFGQVETGMSAGVNTVTVTDGNNCSDFATIILNEPDFLDPNIFENIYSTSSNSITNEISCFGFSDGFLESQTLGGVPSNVGYQYTWVNNSLGNIVSNQSIAENLTANATYTVTVTDANGCISLETSTLLDEPIDFTSDITTTNYAGPTHVPFSVNFIDNTVSNDPYDFNWIWEDGTSYFSSGTIDMNHEFSMDNIGENSIYVIVTNLSTGCIDSVPFIIEAQGLPEINNVFTPNSDGVNDQFSFGEYAMKNIDVTIYNRWGQLVKSWGGMNMSWDGKGIDGNDVPDGVYFYVLVAKGEDGYYYDYKGSITLLR